jgi:SAM-dependent methyltransferase
VNGIYRDRARAEGFGELAATYDHVRPSYPIELVDWLSGKGVGAAVDVGCGTGQVASLLVAAGWSVIGIEPDERMADIARARGIEVVVARFEQWGSSGRDYDLVCSGTAWHWIDPTVGYDIAAGLLRPGGRLALFRNSYIYDSDVADAIGAVLRRLAPHLAQDCIPLGTSSHDLVGTHASEISERTDLFADFARRVFMHERKVTANEWVEELKTHSPVAMLDEDVRERLLGELAEVVTSSGRSRIRIRHETPCVVATRR